MARPLTPQATNALAGGFGIIAVLAIAAYFYFVLGKAPEVTPPASAYNLTKVKAELNAEDGSNVFVKMSKLDSAPVYSSSGDTAVSYTSSEIGKSDLTKLGQ